MKKPYSLILLYIVFASLTINLSCSKDDGLRPPAQPGDLWAAAQQQSDLSTFVELADKLNMSAEFKSENQISLIAPTNDAFSAFLAQKGYADIDDYIASEGNNAEQLLLYHIIEGKIKADAFTNAYIDSKAINAEGDFINIYSQKKNKGEFFFNGKSYSIVSANHNAGNGYIHKINGVLEPADLSTLISANENFSLLMQAIIYSDGNFMKDIADPSHTFFAPDNEAFDALFLELGGVNNISGFSTVYGPQGVNDILYYHSLPSYLKVEDIDSAYYNTMLSSAQVFIHKDDNGNIHLTDAFNREIDLKIANITAVNGNLHIISNILLPY